MLSRLEPWILTKWSYIRFFPCLFNSNCGAEVSLFLPVAVSFIFDNTKKKTFVTNIFTCLHLHVQQTYGVILEAKIFYEKWKAVFYDFIAPYLLFVRAKETKHELTESSYSWKSHWWFGEYWKDINFWILSSG